MVLGNTGKDLRLSLNGQILSVATSARICPLCRTTKAERRYSVCKSFISVWHLHETVPTLGRFRISIRVPALEYMLRRQAALPARWARHSVSYEVRPAYLSKQSGPCRYA